MSGLCLRKAERCEKAADVSNRHQNPRPKKVQEPNGRAIGECPGRTRGDSHCPNGVAPLGKVSLVDHRHEGPLAWKSTFSKDHLPKRCRMRKLPPCQTPLCSRCRRQTFRTGWFCHSTSIGDHTSKLLRCCFLLKLGTWMWCPHKARRRRTWAS